MDKTLYAVSLACAFLAGGNLVQIIRGGTWFHWVLFFALAISALILFRENTK